MRKKSMKNKKTDNYAIEGLFNLLDEYIERLSEDDNEISSICGSMVKRDKSEYSARQLKEIDKLNKELEDMNSILRDIGGNDGF